MRQFNANAIKNSINHWKVMLEATKCLNESSNTLITEFEMTFGTQVVRSPNADFVFDNINTFKIFDVLNKICFDGKLNEFKVDANTISQYPAFKLADNNKEILDDLARFKKEKINQFFYGAYVPILKEGYDPYHISIDDFMYEPLYINLSVGPMTFAYAISLMAHEMIHAYDVHYDTYCRAFKKTKPFDEHKTQYFISKAAELNKLGLSIMDKGHNQAKMNANAYEKLSSTIFEDESNLDNDWKTFKEMISADVFPNIKMTDDGKGIMFING